MRAIVVGASGQIGNWLMRLLAERGHEAIGSYYSVPFPGLIYLDTADTENAARWLSAQAPDVVFYPAGFTWVDGCERDPVLARSSNLLQPLRLAGVTKDLGARFVYFSTDYVFDGLEGPYSESDPPRPLSVYGRAKFEAELALADELREALLVVRTCWVFGPERQGKNFAYQVVRSLVKGQQITCPSDQWSCPSYAPEVALSVVRMVESKVSGLVHVAGPEWIDRTSFARRIAESFGLNLALVVSKRTSDLSQVALRPMNSGLITKRYDTIGSSTLNPLANCLLDFHTRLASDEGWLDPLVAS